MNERRTGIFTPAGGFTLLELIVVLGIFTTLAMIALPLFVQWRESAEYRNAANSVFSTLRTARSRAIELNRQCRVEFDNPNRRFRLMQGDQSYNTAAGNWTDIGSVGNWYEIKYVEVTMLAAPNVVTFDPNGTAENPTGASQLVLAVDIRDTNAAANRFWIGVETTGRIRAEIRR